jgi:hypothetical protein
MYHLYQLFEYFGIGQGQEKKFRRNIYIYIYIYSIDSNSISLQTNEHKKMGLLGGLFINKCCNPSNLLSIVLVVVVIIIIIRVAL